jgi:hypothetical protein
MTAWEPRSYSLSAEPLALELPCPGGIEEDALSKRTYGILAGVIGFGAWWWSRHRVNPVSGAQTDRGRVIFHNTPESSALSGEGVI